MVNIKCGQSHCKFKLTAYQFHKPEDFNPPPTNLLTPSSADGSCSASIKSNNGINADLHIQDDRLRSSSSTKSYSANNSVSVDLHVQNDRSLGGIKIINTDLDLQYNNRSPSGSFKCYTANNSRSLQVNK